MLEPPVVRQCNQVLLPPAQGLLQRPALLSEALSEQEVPGAVKLRTFRIADSNFGKHVGL